MTERLFLALWPPEIVLDEVERALPHGLDALRWQPRERWHITVAFLGDRKPDRELQRFARLPAEPASAVRLNGSGTFGPVLWLGVQNSDWLPGLAHRVRAAFGVEDRRYRPHLTVARARGKTGQRDLRTARTALHPFTSSAWVPEELTLVRSTIGPHPLYEVMGRCPLSAA